MRTLARKEMVIYMIVPTRGDTWKKVEIRPITFKVACDFVNKNHRHHRSSGQEREIPGRIIRTK